MAFSAEPIAAELIALCLLSLLTLVPLFPHSVAAQGDPPPAIVVSPGTLNIDEGDRSYLQYGGFFTVEIKPASTERVVVNLIIDNSDVIISTTDITIFPGAAAQSVRVRAPHDADNQNETATITLSTASITTPDVTVEVNVKDDDPPSGNIVLDNTDTLTVNEGSTATFTVKLDTEPDADVTVAITSADTDAVTVSPATLTFTDEDYDKTQTVTVTGVEDDDYNDVASVILTLSATGGIDADDATKTVTVVDDEPPPAIVVSPGTLNIDEGDRSYLQYGGFFTVEIKPASTERVVVNLIIDNSDVIISTTDITIFPGAAAQSVRVRAPHDADNQNETATITLSTASITTPDVTVEVNVKDDELPSGNIVLDNTDTLTVIEGSTATFTVKLDTEPSEDVTVAITSADTDAVTVSPASLTFTDSDYDETQTVTVTGVEDDDTTDDSGTITLSASGGIDAPDLMKSVSVTDDDAPSGTIQVTPSGRLNIAEGGSATLSVNLSTAPNADVTISLSKTNSDITLRPTSLTFTASNFRAAQSVRVTAADDADTANDSATITLTASGGITAPQVTRSVSVADNDAPSGTIQVTPSDRLNIAEGGSATLSVSLDTAPNADVTISLSKTNSDITLRPTSLTFTASNFRAAQSVRVTAAEDADTANDSDTITFEASGGIDAPDVTKAVSVADNDTPPPPTTPPPPPSPPPSPYTGGIEVTPAGPFEIAEGGRFAFSLRLTEQPDSNAKIDLSTSNPDLSLLPNAITFAPSHWARFVEVSLHASEDADSEDETGRVIFKTGSRDISSISVSITDDDNEEGDRQPIKSHALALPPPESGDSATLRIRCKQGSACSVAFDCTAQETGEVFEGRLPEPIPAWGAVSLSSRDIQSYTGGESWAGWSDKGRLGCALRSSATIGSQVWTRSGSGVLVNNSAFIRSVFNGREYRADIESIPSLDSFDESNIRIRCDSDEAHCDDFRFVCYTDDGAKYETTFDGLARKRTIHLQSQSLATRLGIRWQEWGLTCEVRSNGSFTAQVLTRTGGGGALVNNSATGVR